MSSERKQRGGRDQGGGGGRGEEDAERGTDTLRSTQHKPGLWGWLGYFVRATPTLAGMPHPIHADIVAEDSAGNVCGHRLSASVVSRGRVELDECVEVALYTNKRQQQPARNGG